MRPKEHDHLKLISVIQSLLLAISLLITSLAFAYYLLIYLPNKDIQKLEFENKLKTEQIQRDHQQEISEEQTKKAEYEACIKNAHDRYWDDWLAQCKPAGMPITKNKEGRDSCSLPKVYSDELNKGLQNDKDTCLKIYQNN